MYIKFEFWARENTNWFDWYECADFKILTIFKWFHFRLCKSKEDYDNLPQA